MPLQHPAAFKPLSQIHLCLAPCTQVTFERTAILGQIQSCSVIPDLQAQQDAPVASAGPVQVAMPCERDSRNHRISLPSWKGLTRITESNSLLTAGLLQTKPYD